MPRRPSSAGGAGSLCVPVPALSVRRVVVGVGAPSPHPVRRVVVRCRRRWTAARVGRHVVSAVGCHGRGTVGLGRGTIPGTTVRTGSSALRRSDNEVSPHTATSVVRLMAGGWGTAAPGGLGRAAMAGATAGRGRSQATAVRARPTRAASPTALAGFARRRRPTGRRAVARPRSCGRRHPASSNRPAIREAPVPVGSGPAIPPRRASN